MIVMTIRMMIMNDDNRNNDSKRIRNSGLPFPEIHIQSENRIGIND